MPAICGLAELTELQTEGDPAFRPSEVRRCKKYFDSLMITPIDKCSQHLLMIMVNSILQREIYCCL